MSGFDNAVVNDVRRYRQPADGAVWLAAGAGNQLVTLRELAETHHRVPKAVDHLGGVGGRTGGDVVEDRVQVTERARGNKNCVFGGLHDPSWWSAIQMLRAELRERLV